MDSVQEITPENIATAKNNRASRIFREEGRKLDAMSIPDTDLVFRVTTWDHIPLLPPKAPKPVKSLKSRKSNIARNEAVHKFFEEILTEETPEAIEDLEIVIKTPIREKTVKADHVKINFPPFWHYRLQNGELVVVGKSHWTGPLDSGEFCKTQGDMTHTLACMLMKLTEKFALKGNWRGYSYREEMQGQAVLQLCQVALQFDESKGQNPFSFLTQVSFNSFLRVLNIEKNNQKIRDKLLVDHHMNPSYSATNHDAPWNEE